MFWRRGPDYCASTVAGGVWAGKEELGHDACAVVRIVRVRLSVRGALEHAFMGRWRWHLRSCVSLSTTVVGGGRVACRGFMTRSVLFFFLFPLFPFDVFASIKEARNSEQLPC